MFPVGKEQRLRKVVLGSSGLFVQLLRAYSFRCTRSGLAGKLLKRYDNCKRQNYVKSFSLPTQHGEFLSEHFALDLSLQFSSQHESVSSDPRRPASHSSSPSTRRLPQKLSSGSVKHRVDFARRTFHRKHKVGCEHGS